MAPLFGESSRPPRAKKESASTAPPPPVFSFNAQRSAGTGFFRSPAGSPTAQHHRKTSSIDDSWADMGDDRSEATEVDDSRALTFLDEESRLNMLEDQNAEVTVFSQLTDESKLFKKAGFNAATARKAGFKLLEGFESYAFDQVQASDRLISELEETPAEASGDLSYLEIHEAENKNQSWRLEHQTWQLVRMLITHRLDGDMEEDIPQDLLQNRFASNAQLREHLLRTDKTFKEIDLVLEWLQTYAAEPSEYDLDLQNRGDRGWMYTKEKIKQNKRMSGKQFALMGGSMNVQTTVTKLDPDAPIRQQRPLEQEDEDYDQALMKLVWTFVRRGDLERAQEICEASGEFWRAASLSGGEDAWDPTIDGMRDEEDHYISGNRRRELWRRMCYAIAHRKGGNEYEKAVYGVLCGDVESVEPVCESWEDLLFANMNALVEGYYSNYLAKLGRIPASVAHFKSPITAVQLNDDTTVAQVIDSLAQHEYMVQMKDPLRAVQGSLISKRFEDLVVELDRQLREYNNSSDYDAETDELSVGLYASDFRLMRVVTHVLIVLQATDASYMTHPDYHDAAEGVIAGYIKILMSMDKYELIPLYASRLSPERAIHEIGNAYAAIESGGDRLEGLIRVLHTHGLDADACLKRVMEVTLKRTEPEYNVISAHGFKFKGFVGESTEGDQQLIRGLEWLALGGDSLRAELTRKGYEIYKRFLLTGRLLSAKVLYDNVKSEDIIPARPELNGFSDMMDMEEPVDEFEADEDTRLAAAVYIEMENLIGSFVALEEWQKTLRERPERPDRTFGRSIRPLFETVDDRLRDLVKEFMASSEVQAMPDILTIRNIYVPELVLSLHKVYVQAGTYIDKKHLIKALDLAADVADPERNIQDTFKGTGRLDEYVEQIANASRVILGTQAESDAELGIWKVSN